MTLRGAAIAVLIFASAPAWATDYSAPLSPSAAAFKARFAERQQICRQQSAQQLGISADRATAFCACQLDVFARNATAEELTALITATFGTKDEDEKDSATPRALATVARILPERKRVCGY